MSDYQRPEPLAAIERSIDEWLAAVATSHSQCEAVQRGEPGDFAEPRWYVRLRGEEREFITIWFILGQRTLRYEVYVMPWPEENAAELFELVLRRNDRLVGAHFSIGVEDALFLRGELLLSSLSDAELDRVIGSLYAYVEQFFPELVRLGFASRFKGD